MRCALVDAVPEKAQARGTPAEPWRLRIAQMAGRLLPPVIAHVVTHRIYTYAHGYRDAYPFVVPARTGSPYAGVTSDVHAHHFALHGYYDWKLWVVAMVACRPGDVIVEVGANVGTETVGFADIVGPNGRVYAFEPFPPNVAALRAAIAAAGQRQVVVVADAVSDVESDMSFVAPAPTESGSGYLVGADAGPSTTRVKAITLDGYLGRERRIRLVVADAEGHELAILRGARERIAADRPILALEACPAHLRRAGGSVAELAQALQEADYVTRRIGRLGLQEPDLSDAATPCNWVAVPANERGLLSLIARAIRTNGTRPFGWSRPH